MITKQNIDMLDKSITELNKSLDSLGQSIDYLNAFVGNQYHRKLSMKYIDILRNCQTSMMHSINTLRGLHEAYTDILEDKN